MLNEVPKFPEVPAYSGLDEIGDACIPVVAAFDDFLDLLRETLWQVHGVVPVFPASHSRLIQPLLVNKVYISSHIMLDLAKNMVV